jgi:hypothetical protein
MKTDWASSWNLEVVANTSIEQLNALETEGKVKPRQMTTKGMRKKRSDVGCIKATEVTQALHWSNQLGGGHRRQVSAFYMQTCPKTSLS